MKLWQAMAEVDALPETDLRERLIDTLVAMGDLEDAHEEERRSWEKSNDALEADLEETRERLEKYLQAEADEGEVKVAHSTLADARSDARADALVRPLDPPNVIRVDFATSARKQAIDVSEKSECGLKLPSRPERAYSLYCRAAEIDEDPAQYPEAERLYKLAISMDPNGPTGALALTNLGNVRYRRGDEAAAKEYYDRALEIDPRQPEALYNLGYLLKENGDEALAIPFFRKALDTDARFADAHFNLAAALSNQGRQLEATKHWREYLKLQPNGPGAETAHDRLGELKTKAAKRARR